MPKDSAPAGSVAYLTNSKTTVPKATYVPVKVPQDDKSHAMLATSGGAIRKAGFVNGLRLQVGEVDAVLARISGANAAGSAPSPLYALLRNFEGQPLRASLPPASQFFSVADVDLIAFGNALASVRKQNLATAQRGVVSSAGIATFPDPAEVASLTSAWNSALVSAAGFAAAANSATSPLGMLNLERIEMTPAGIERGGLLATIPLAPKERTVVVQQEWSVITKEFTSIVTDSLDNYSETGVTDTTQLSQATTSQVAHNNQFNVNASASGSCGFVTASVATSFGAQDQHSQSASDSRQHSVQTTKKASARSIQSLKTTISTTTTAGTSTGNTRILENPSATDPMRIDYFSLMRKWHVALYRYGLRLTYDITVPEPGAAMREQYAQLDQLQQALSTTFVFPINHSDITADVKPGESQPHYLVLADYYKVDVPPPPSPAQVVVQGCSFLNEYWAFRGQG